MTLAEFFNKWDGHAEYNYEKQKQEWVRTRWLATLFLQPHLKKGRKMSPEQLCKFEWEKTASKKNEEIDNLRKEEREKFFNERFKTIKKFL